MTTEEDDRETLDYGEECIISFGNAGATVRCPPFEHDGGDCSYVRVVDAGGNEVAYWVADEWAEDPGVVMGAILGCMKGAS